MAFGFTLILETDAQRMTNKMHASQENLGEGTLKDTKILCKREHPFSINEIHLPNLAIPTYCL